MVKKPRVDDLWEQAQGLIEMAAERDQLYERLELLYDQTAPAPGAGADEDADNPAVQVVTMPYSTNAVDLVYDLASQMDYYITVPANRETKKAAQTADEMEQFFRAWKSYTEKRLQRNLTGEMAWFAAMRARVVMRVLFLEDAIQADGADYRQVKAPLLLQRRDPREVYIEDGPEGPTTVVERWPRLVSTIRRYHPNVLRDAERYHASDTIDWTELWTDKYRVYWAGNEPVRTAGGAVLVPHGYGCLPYVIANARVTPRRDEAKAVRPLLTGVESTAENLNTWFSILTTAGWAAVTNAWAIFSDRYGVEGGPELDTTPGALNYFFSNEKLQAIQRGVLPSDFFQLGKLWIQAFQHGTFPFALYGEMPASLAGYAINLLTQSGRRPLVPIWNAIENGYAGAFRLAALIARNKVAPLVGDKIHLVVVGEATTPELSNRAVRRQVLLDTTAVGDDFDVQVTLSDPMPQDDAANLRMAMEAKASGTLSHETALTKFKIVPDATAELDRIQVEKIYAQFAQIEAVKQAAQRGYIPDQLTVPPGWKMMPDGRLAPEALLAESPQSAPEVQPLAGMMPQPSSPEQQPRPVDPRRLQEIAAMTPPPGFNELTGAPPPPLGMT